MSIRLGGPPGVQAMCVCGPPTDPQISSVESSEVSFLYGIEIIKYFGAGRGTRTPDILITNQVLYQLS